MNKILNTGTIYVRCANDKLIRPVRFRFEQEAVLFEFDAKRMRIKSDGTNLYCQMTNTKKKASFCDSYTEAINLLIESDEREPLRGQIIIKDMPFRVSFSPGGFAFNCDLGVAESSYLISINNRQISVAKTDKIESKSEQPSQVAMESCDNLTEALAFIYQSAYTIFKELVNKPERLN